MNNKQNQFFAKAHTDAWATYTKSTPNPVVSAVFQADVKTVLANQLESFMSLYDPSRKTDHNALVIALGPMISSAMAAHKDKLPALATINNECNN